MKKRLTRFGVIPPLPNHESRHETPLSLTYDSYYVQNGIGMRWTWERYLRLAKLLKLTPYELGSLATLRHSQVDYFRQRNFLPPAVIMPIGLILTMVEAKHASRWSADVVENPLPDFGNLSQEAASQ